MGIEQRIEELENLTKQLNDKVEYLEEVNHDKWVTAKELSEIMNCSLNNVYIKIRSGEIYATDKLGSIPRIPLSQFYINKKGEEKTTIKPRNNQKVLTMKERVFG